MARASDEGRTEDDRGGATDDPIAAAPFVAVALPVPVRTSFTYAVPQAFAARLRRGSRVRVPFGRRRLLGVVIDRAPLPPEVQEVREIEALLDREPLVPGPILDLASWIARYYHAPVGEAMKLGLGPMAVEASGRGSAGGPGRTAQDGAVGASTDASDPVRRGNALPGGSSSGPGPSGGATGPGADDAIAVVRLAPGIEAAALPLDRRASRLRAILDGLALLAGKGGWVRLEALRARTAASAAHLAKLRERGWIETGSMAVASDGPGGGLCPDDGLDAGDGHGALGGGGGGARGGGDGISAGEEPGGVGGPARGDWPAEGSRPRSGRETVPAPVPPPELTPAQRAAADRIIEAVDRRTPSVFVLRGVTGSGKTEVYFAAARRALDRGRGVIFLVPEIALTPAFTRRVRERFGEQVAVLHSALRLPERRADWERARRGAAPLVVGPRSALFAPVAALGLIVVDEEHDASYKQEETPRYHARDMALVRARAEGAVTILGSATPSVESWQAALSGRFERLDLPSRVADRPLPEVEIVDMKEEFRRRGGPALLSSRLREALLDAHAAGEQGIVLINRRGYAAFALCRACGDPIGCPQCSVSLVYHRTDESLRCHYCNHRQPRPEACPACGSPHLVYQGEGTERVERHLERELDGLRVARLDRDSARGRGAHEKVLGAFERGETDVLVGTQMVAKGHDFPGVTVVGVLAADAVLGFPDFRAAERTFQLLTQVAGRAGRGDRPGRVLVQAYRTEHYALRAAIRHDHDAFFSREVRYRRALRYPPFTNLAAITVFGKELDATAARARAVARLLTTHGGGRLQVLGPALAPLARLRGRFRFQILLKGRARGRIGDAIDRALESLAAEPGGTRDLVVDVDPLQLL